MSQVWKTSKREIALDGPLVMGILNVTPDSFSDGGEFASIDAAVRHAEAMIADGADIIDVGGESTRPGGTRVSVEEETARVVRVIEAIATRFDTPISIDTTKDAVAAAALDAGAEIINDISGLRWDVGLASLAAETHAGLVLMHSRGEFETMHSLPAVEDIAADVCDGLRNSIALATAAGVMQEQIVLDAGIGFGKTQDQNLELLAKLDRIVGEFEMFPMMIGTSRKSSIGKLLGDAPPPARLGGSLATALVGLRNGASILRVHDIRETVAACKAFAATSAQK
jgi:dihydropteroate synthase